MSEFSAEVGCGDGQNIYGEVENVMPGNVATIVTLNAADNWRFLGFLAGGDTDAEFWVEFDGIPKYRDAINISRPRAALVLSAPDPEASGAVARVRVRNTGPVPASYNANLLGAA